MGTHWIKYKKRSWNACAEIVSEDIYILDN